MIIFAVQSLMPQCPIIYRIGSCQRRFIYSCTPLTVDTQSSFSSIVIDAPYFVQVFCAYLILIFNIRSTHYKSSITESGSLFQLSISRSKTITLSRSFPMLKSSFIPSFIAVQIYASSKYSLTILLHNSMGILQQRMMLSLTNMTVRLPSTEQYLLFS